MEWATCRPLRRPLAPCNAGQRNTHLFATTNAQISRSIKLNKGISDFLFRVLESLFVQFGFWRACSCSSGFVRLFVQLVRVLERLFRLRHFWAGQVVRSSRTWGYRFAISIHNALRLKSPSTTTTPSQAPDSSPTALPERKALKKDGGTYDEHESAAGSTATGGCTAATWCGWWCGFTG